MEHNRGQPQPRGQLCSADMRPDSSEREREREREEGRVVEDDGGRRWEGVK